MKKKFTFIVLVISFGSFFLRAQEITNKELNLEEVIKMAMENHPQLKISQANYEISEQQVKVAKLQQLPNASISASGYHLSNATLYSPQLEKVTEVEMPHFGNTYALQASQLLFKGGLINKSIQMAELRAQIAELDIQKDQQSIKFLVISNYMDIYKLHNQIKVYEKNIGLSRTRLENLKNMSSQQMITRNELVRAELQIKNLEQALLSLKNNLAILSNQMSYALGLAQNIIIVPTDSIETMTTLSLDAYLELANKQHFALSAANTNIEIAKKNIGVAKSELFPTIAAFAGYNMQRPLSTSTPVLDYYANTWQAGISLSYNLDNLYKTRHKIRLAGRQEKMTEAALELTQQNVDAGVFAAYTKYQEAVQQSSIMEEAQKLAVENYLIVESKYFNQLAITAEMTDATNARLEAELQHVNSKISVLFQYYNLLKSTGSL
jgi:outer membrane protein